MCIYNIESSKNKKNNIKWEVVFKVLTLSLCVSVRISMKHRQKIIKSTYVDNRGKSDTQTIDCFFYSLPLCGRHTAVAPHNQCDLQSLQRNSKNKHHTYLTIFLLYNTQTNFNTEDKQSSQWLIQKSPFSF